MKLIVLCLILSLNLQWGSANSKDNKITTEKRRQNIENILELNESTTSDERGIVVKNTLDELLDIYKKDIKPLEEAYRFSDLNVDAISDGEIFAKPMILFIGPWSVGKTTMINYLLNMENSGQKLHTGAAPTTTDFTVILSGSPYRTIKGMELVTDTSHPFLPLNKFGLKFTQRLQGVQIPSKLLEKFTIIDTPGIIENRKQQKRGYPFGDVCQWFIDRADLIFLLIDHTKLDFGSELGTLFEQIKGHETKIRLILNKADAVSSQELMRVYGALFWSLAPLMDVVEPPRVYVGSFWSMPYANEDMSQVFYQEEIALLKDIHQMVRNYLENKVAFLRRHAVLVRLHVLVVDGYIKAYKENKSFWAFWNDNKLVVNAIIERPELYQIRHKVLKRNDISRHDFPTGERYRKFFEINSLITFDEIESHCPSWLSFRSTCKIDDLETAITWRLPKLLTLIKSRAGTCTKGRNCPS